MGARSSAGRRKHGQALRPSVARNCWGLLTLACNAALFGCGASGLPTDLLGTDNSAATSAGQPSPRTAAGSGGQSSGVAGTMATRRDPPIVDAGARDARVPDSAIPDAGLRNPPALMGDAGMPADGFCAGGTHVGDLTVTSEVDIARLKGCTRIVGNLVIATTSLTDMKGLETLNVIEGTLRIVSDLNVALSVDSGVGAPSILRSLAGLEGLQRVQRLELDILPITTLQNLSGLQSAGELIIWRLEALRDLKGLEHLSWNSAIIAANSALQTLDGLAVPAAARQLILYANGQLVTIGAWQQLQELNSLGLADLPALKSLDGLRGLQRLDQLTMLNCDALLDLTGLDGLVISSSILIEQNQQLRTLSGLAIGPRASSVAVVDNPQLESLAGAIGAGAPGLEISLVGLPALKTLADLGTLQAAMALLIQRCDGLTDLSGLGPLRSLDRLELVDCANLHSLNGAGALESVSGSFSIDNMSALTSLQGLTNLKKVAVLVLRGRSALSSLDGLGGITNLDRFQLSGNATLRNLHGLEQVALISTLVLDNNVALQSLDGLPALAQYAVLSLDSNPVLTSVLALSPLVSAVQLAITNNAALSDLTGLEHLTTADSLMITSNPALSSLRALGVLTHVQKLDITDNRRLPQCEVDWLSKRIQLSVPTGQNGPQGVCAP